MTISEFKAWLDGFSEYMEEPTCEDWEKMKEKLSTVKERYYFERWPTVTAPYVQTTQPFWISNTGTSPPTDVTWSNSQ